MHILLVEDDAVLGRAVAQGLSDAGHRVELACCMNEALYCWEIQAFDVVLLDLWLPYSAHARSGLGSGLSVLRSRRARGDCTPVLILSAHDSLEERIVGLDAGADDYLGKPYSLKEVEARMRALVRRASATTDLVAVGELVLNRLTRRFSIAHHSLELPAREFELLWELMTPPGRVLSKHELSRRLSDTDEALGDNALEAFASRLRRRLQGSGASIRTLRGLGYLLDADDAGDAGDVVAP